MIEYHWRDNEKIIRVIGQNVENIDIKVEDVVSYLNEMIKTYYRLRDNLKKLLKASLDGRNQNQIQNEIATILGYPGIEGFIKEEYGKFDLKTISKIRQKEEKILTAQGVVIDESEACSICGSINCSCVGL